jgi:glycosyltransferase involved in cell wall biosynthesis
MPKLTALIHTHNDARRIGRALESLRACDELVVVDHNSTDGTAQIARQYGAVVATPEGALTSTGHDWVLLLQPSEAISESLESTLYTWKQEDPGALAFAVRIREETPGGWELQPAETRLLRRSSLPSSCAQLPSVADAPLLEGDLLRFRDS